jgi:hypothetical protein
VTLDFQGALPVNPVAEAPLYIAALPATAAALAQRPPAAQAMTKPAPAAAPAHADGAAAGGGVCFTAAQMSAHVDMLLLFSEPPPTAALGRRHDSRT